MYKKFNAELIKAKLSLKPWESSHASNFKKHIKELILKKQNYYCCYCQRDLDKDTNRIKHIEHILPKSKFPLYMFDLTNLAISCVRCNSDKKLADISFLNITEGNYTYCWCNAIYQSGIYKFVHPNIDIIQEHLIRKTFACNNRIYYQYKCLSKKGFFHYKYFDLCFFESEDISKNQGIMTNKLASSSKQLVDELFKKHNQPRLTRR
ncbi:HNH endonuclease [Photobacterium iliopiscarium]|uniref:TIGR02646 family protein n=1 Tax=Photobacterium iliopiscarium TaxID=56192 RepID=A0A2T3MNI0_9GAMM|nr:hypothetical protein [Photobacterium iliopiscarium]PSV98310.1 hypothetical protein C9I88_06500 [Photobacterium iliopiscarium]